ncbi:MAG: DUF4140 domain-containing protein, partial [Deltaproteobacteria bacterium]|nr:DUF4140 domain-containing protein [Deltaproteobacteria bacterium]
MVGAAVDARIEHVTLYASGARVRRLATVAAAEAPVPQRIRIVGLPLSVIDDTVRVEIEGGAVATNVRCGIAAPPQAAAAAEEIAEVRAARR